jgi:CheY-like chemotaxis protein
LFVYGYTGGPAMNKRILVADMPETDSRLTGILKGYLLAFVRTLDDAMRALKTQKHDLLLVGVHFDDSRMFDMLRRIRSDPRCKDLPVVCFRGFRRGSIAISSETLDIVCRALNANAFVDLTSYADNEEGNRALRAAVDRLSQG